MKTKHAYFAKKNKHHRKCLSLGGSSHPENISIVDAKTHQAYHRLFGNMRPYQIAEELNRVWIDPAFTFKCLRKGQYVSDLMLQSTNV